MLKGTCLMRTFQGQGLSGMSDEGRCYQAEVCAVSLRRSGFSGAPLALHGRLRRPRPHGPRLSAGWPAFLNGRRRSGSTSASGSLRLRGLAWISLCTDRGQASRFRLLALIRTRPYPHTSRRYKVLEESLRIRSATGEKPYSICTTKYL